MAHKVMESFGSDQDEDATEQDKGRNQDVGAGGDTMEAEVLILGKWMVANRIGVSI